MLVNMQLSANLNTVIKMNGNFRRGIQFDAMLQKRTTYYGDHGVIELDC